MKTNSRPQGILIVCLSFMMLCAALPSQAQESGAARNAGRRRMVINTLTDAEKASGWQLLFDGKTLAGWRGLGLQSLPKPFVVENGLIHKVAGAKAEADLMTEKVYENFELTFDWKISPAGNNGIKYNVSEAMSQGPEKKNHASLGFEYQILDDEKAGDRLDKKHQCGALYELFAADDAQKRVRPVGRWNSSRIVFDGNHIEHWLNGKKIVEAELGTPAMNAALAASKWKKIKDFGAKRAGHIVITDHQSEAWYRNLKIRELPRK